MGLLKDIAELQDHSKSETGPSIPHDSICIASHLRGKVFQTERNAVLARRVQVADR